MIRVILMVAVLVAGLTISAHSQEIKGDPFAFHNPDRDFTLAVIAYSLGIPAPGLEFETGIIMGIEADANLRTYAGNVASHYTGEMVAPVMMSGPMPGSIMIDARVLAKAVKEAATAATGGGVEKDGILKTTGAAMAKHPVYTVLGLFATGYGINYAYQKNRDNDDEPTAQGGAGDDQGNDKSVCNFAGATINAAVHCDASSAEVVE